MSEIAQIDKKYIENQVRQALQERFDEQNRRRRPRNKKPGLISNLITSLWMLKGGNPYSMQDPSVRQGAQGEFANFQNIIDYAEQIEDATIRIHPNEWPGRFGKALKDNVLAAYGKFEEAVSGLEVFLFYGNDRILQAINEVESTDTRYLPRVKDFFRIFNVRCSGDNVTDTTNTMNSASLTSFWFQDPARYCINNELEELLGSYYSKRRGRFIKRLLNTSTDRQRLGLYKRELAFLKNHLRGYSNKWDLTYKNSQEVLEILASERLNNLDKLQAGKIFSRPGKIRRFLRRLNVGKLENKSQSIDIILKLVESPENILNYDSFNNIVGDALGNDEEKIKSDFDKINNLIKPKDIVTTPCGFDLLVAAIDQVDFDVSAEEYLEYVEQIPNSKNGWSKFLEKEYKDSYYVEKIVRDPRYFSKWSTFCLIMLVDPAGNRLFGEWESLIGDIMKKDPGKENPAGAAGSFLASMSILVGESEAVVGSLKLATRAVASPGLAAKIGVAAKTSAAAGGMSPFSLIIFSALVVHAGLTYFKPNGMFTETDELKGKFLKAKTILEAAVRKLKGIQVREKRIFKARLEKDAKLAKAIDDKIEESISSFMGSLVEQISGNFDGEPVLPGDPTAAMEMSPDDWKRVEDKCPMYYSNDNEKQTAFCKFRSDLIRIARERCKEAASRSRVGSLPPNCRQDGFGSGPFATDGSVYKKIWEKDVKKHFEYLWTRQRSALNLKPVDKVSVRDEIMKMSVNNVEQIEMFFNEVSTRLKTIFTDIVEILHKAAEDAIASDMTLGLLTKAKLQAKLQLADQINKSINEMKNQLNFKNNKFFLAPPKNKKQLNMSIEKLDTAAKWIGENSGQFNKNLEMLETSTPFRGASVGLKEGNSLLKESKIKLNDKAQIRRMASEIGIPRWPTGPGKSGHAQTLESASSLYLRLRHDGDLGAKFKKSVKKITLHGRKPLAFWNKSIFKEHFKSFWTAFGERSYGDENKPGQPTTAVDFRGDKKKKAKLRKPYTIDARARAIRGENSIGTRFFNDSPRTAYTMIGTENMWNNTFFFYSLTIDENLIRNLSSGVGTGKKGIKAEERILYLRNSLTGGASITTTSIDAAKTKLIAEAKRIRNKWADANSYEQYKFYVLQGYIYYLDVFIRPIAQIIEKDNTATKAMIKATKDLEGHIKSAKPKNGIVDNLTRPQYTIYKQKINELKEHAGIKLQCFHAISEISKIISVQKIGISLPRVL